MTPRINRDRLLGRLETFNRIGALPGGGNCRLALTDEDRAGRDLLVEWMRELGLKGHHRRDRQHRRRARRARGAAAGDVRLARRHGRYDGFYGVLAGLEACEAVNDGGGSLG